MDLLNKLARGRYLIVFTLAILFILGAVLLENFNDLPPEASILRGHHTWTAFLKELGFAFIIALIVMVTIEHNSREEFNRAINQRMSEIQDNVFKATFSRNIPRPLIEEVENLVLKADFVRRSHRATYRLKIASARELNLLLGDYKVVVVDVTTSYFVKNVAGIKKDFPLRLELEKPPIEGLDSAVKIESVKINGQELMPEVLQQGDQAAPDTPDFKCFAHVVKDVEPGAEVEVITKCRQVKFLNDMEIWRSLLPSDGMTLTLYLPPEAIGYSATVPTRFGANALHRTELNSRVSDRDAGYYEWVLDKAVLPHQGIVFWWKFDDIMAIQAATRVDKK